MAGVSEQILVVGGGMIVGCGASMDEAKCGLRQHASPPIKLVCSPDL
jgi:hypothetical protein